MLASYKSCKVVIRDNAKFLPIASINEDFFFSTRLFPPAAGFRSYQRHGPGLGPLQRSGRRLGPSGSARCKTSSRAGASACAGPGKARARPSAV